MRPLHVYLTFIKELRETLRDRRTLAMMLLLPLVVYPILALVVSQVFVAREKAQVERRAKVAVLGEGTVASDLRQRIAARDKRFELVVASGPAEIETGRIDAAVRVAAVTAEVPTKIEIVFDASRDESRLAAERLEELLASALPSGCVSSFAIKMNDLASSAKLGGYVLSKALPMIIMLMVLLGAFYPAVDVTAGERERGTLETVLSSPIRRFDLLLGKVLAVALVAAATGLLNLASMSATLIHAFGLAVPDLAIPIPWTRAASSTLVIVPSALLFAALFVAIGSIARGFKEAQSLLMPVYFLFVAPSMVGAVGEFPLSPLVALIPGMNVTLLARDLVLGTASGAAAAMVLGSTLVYCAIALVFAARLYDSEQFLDPGLAGKKKRSRAEMADPSHVAPTAGQAMAIFAVGFVLLYFAFVPLQKADLVSGLVLSQWGGMFGLVALFARLTRRPLAKMVAFNRPPTGALAGGLLIGACAWAGVAVISEWLVPVPKELVEAMKRAFLPTDGSRTMVTNLLLLAVTPAICEELFFRGVVLRGLATRLAPGMAVLITGLLFGLFHLDVYRLLPTSILGILFSWVALRSGSILPSMGAHLLNNGILLVLAAAQMDERLSKIQGVWSVLVLLASLGGVAGGIQLIRRSAPSREL